VQAITNTSGSGWTVNHNVIEDLTLFIMAELQRAGIVDYARGSLKVRDRA
jgi:hypothetical protein